MIDQKQGPETDPPFRSTLVGGVSSVPFFFISFLFLDLDVPPLAVKK